jgi:hypothetical protein
LQKHKETGRWREQRAGAYTLQQIRAARIKRHHRVQLNGTRDGTDEIMEFDRLALLNKASNKTRPGLLKIAARQRELQRLPKEAHICR